MLNITSASISISPDFSVSLGCNGFIHEQHDQIDHELEINAILLRQSDEMVLIISVDTLFVSEELKDWVIDIANPILDINKEQIFIVATHTHYAPFLVNNKPNLGKVDDQYIAYFKQQLEALINGLLEEPQMDVDVRICIKKTNGLSVGRRKKVWHLRKGILPWRSIQIFPNEETDIDTNLSLLKFYKKNSDDVLAVIWNWACHPVQYHSPKNITAHFPGEIRDHIRNKTQQKIPVVFLQGFSGDSRPNIIQKKPMSIKEKLIVALNKAYGFTSFTKNSYTEWVRKLIVKVEDTWSCDDSQTLDINIKTRNSSISLDSIRTQANHSNVEFQLIQLSDNVMLIGVGAEIVSDYAIKLRKDYPEVNILPVGCLGSVFGYWPTKKMIKEKGYEVTGFLNGFSLKGKFRGNVEQTFNETIKHLFKK